MNFANNWNVQLYQPDAESAKWRLILRFLGVESTPIREEQRIATLLLEGEPGLVIFDRQLLGESFATLGTACEWWIKRGGGIALSGTSSGLWPIPESFLNAVTDISERDPFAINDLLQRFVSSYSRNHPRLETRLPALYAQGEGTSHICEIMNLSPGGAFIRTTQNLPAHDCELLVNVPLMGMHKELELVGRVVRHVTPHEQNNYIQGIGIQFVAPESAQCLTELNNYLRYMVANDEAIAPQVTPFSGYRGARDEIASASLQQGKGRERKLSTIR